MLIDLTRECEHCLGDVAARYDDSDQAKTEMKSWLLNKEPDPNIEF